ncbi:hypothetical protein HHK36_015561 [Tetracentron sinense]|uniref:Uncharacterized protein n=1 Tax=Tetracentron sinense TaxID=13715 RepID=A0A834Z5E5_TETSI|nr:hypothetical protein HHK36_015561 [Tetracentron sinense]
MDKKPCNSEDAEVRKGPWTMEEDLILINYIANHGEGVWNSLARSAGLKRTGKSCRLRWLNYLRPDVRRGNITPEEQLLIMELHARWGNRIQKHIKQAEPLPGQCSELNDNASSSQMCDAGDGVDQPYSPTYSGNLEPFPLPLPNESDDNFWSVEDLWTLP